MPRLPPVPTPMCYIFSYDFHFNNALVLSQADPYIRSLNVHFEVNAFMNKNLQLRING